MKPYHFILTDFRQPVAEPDFLKWAKWIETHDRIVRQDIVRGVATVSTVFLGTDHNWSRVGPPLLFETMIFASSFEEINELQWRYPTWLEAEKGHQRAVNEVKRHLAIRN